MLRRFATTLVCVIGAAVTAPWATAEAQTDPHSWRARGSGFNSWQPLSYRNSPGSYYSGRWNGYSYRAPSYYVHPPIIPISPVPYVGPGIYGPGYGPPVVAPGFVRPFGYQYQYHYNYWYGF